MQFENLVSVKRLNGISILREKDSDRHVSMDITSVKSQFYSHVDVGHSMWVT